MALDFLILYEHIVRELDNDCLIMAELARRGYTSELFQLMDRKKLKYFTYKKPQVLVASAMYDNASLNSFVYNNVGRLDKVVNLHWEEMLSHEQEESKFFSLTENAAKCTHICWGPAARDRIVAGGVPADNAVITGAIQLDFLRPQFDGYFKTRSQLAAEYGLDESKRWLLYVSSFSCANMDDKEVEELGEMTDLDFRGFKLSGARSMHTTLEWFSRLLGEHDDLEIIYRPHPTEWQTPPLEEMKSKHDRFKVIKDYTVGQWLRVSDLSAFWISTSIAEAYYTGKPCIVLRPEAVPREYDPVIYEDCNAVASYDALNEAVGSKQLAFPIDEKRMQSYFDIDRSYPTYMRICDLLEETLKNPPRDRPFSQGYKPHFNFVKFIVLFCLRVMNALHINPHWFDWLLGHKITDMTERLMNYFAKAYVPRKQIEARVRELSKYIQNPPERERS